MFLCHFLRKVWVNVDECNSVFEFVSRLRNTLLCLSVIKKSNYISGSIAISKQSLYAASIININNKLLQIMCVCVCVNSSADYNLIDAGSEFRFASYP